MPFPYLDIFEKSIELTRKNLVLWLFGIFAGTISGFNFLFFVWKRLAELPQNLTIFLIILVFLFFSAFSRGVLIWSAEKLGDKPGNFSFKKAVQSGRSFVKEILLSQVLIGLIFTAVNAVLAVPVVYLFWLGETGRAVALIFLGLGIFVPISVFLGFLYIYTPIFLVLYKVRLWPAGMLAFQLLQTKLKESLVLAVFVAGLEVTFMILLTFSIIVVSVPATLVFLVVSAGLGIFSSFVWTLSVIEMVKTQRLEEEKKVYEPEAEPVN